MGIERNIYIAYPGFTCAIKKQGLIMLKIIFSNLVQGMWGYVEKVMTLSKGGSFIVSSATSLLLSPLINRGIEFVDVVFENTSVKNLVLAVITELFMLFIYLGFIWVDNYYGKRVAKKLKKYNANRDYETIVFKLLPYCMITGLVMFISLFFEIMDMGYLYTGSMLFQVTIFIMFCNYEMVSWNKHIKILKGHENKVISKLSIVFEKASKTGIDKFTSCNDSLKEKDKEDMFNKIDDIENEKE